MSKVDKNKRLCSKDVQSQVVKALDIIDSESMMYSLSHNIIECCRLNSAIIALRTLVTNKRTSTLYKGGVIK